MLLFEPIRSDCDEPFPVVLPVTGLVGITGEPEVAVENTTLGDRRLVEIDAV